MPNFNKYFFLLTCLLIANCSHAVEDELNEKYGWAQIREREVSHDSVRGENFTRNVKPILDNRCTVCHGCYDAPCQLKLSSASGIDRGATKELVYEGTRLVAARPTRLDIDESSTAAWRARTFYTVLNERKQTPDNNKQASVLYRLINQKTRHPLPRKEILPDSFTFGINRENYCPKLEEVDDFIKKNPLWGMPYALPGLTESELSTVSRWLIDGSPMPTPAPLTPPYVTEIDRWEQFLNRDSNKGQLVSRYLYEHLFLANLYFDEINKGIFFKLVRSKTPPGKPIDIIATRRPYDSPGTGKFYYRLRRVDETILSKTHMPYALNPNRLARWQQLFFTDSYAVSTLPDYSEKTASNPFSTFSQLPVKSRYRFLLDEAEFSIMNFIKGPVCRGQIALNVIRDNFWVFFENPDNLDESTMSVFLAKESHHLQLPAAEGNTLLPVTNWIKYSMLQRDYLTAKARTVDSSFNNKGQKLDADLIWNGDGENSNAALTVFRHFDSGSVIKGLVGKPPQTAWIIGYPLLERIHYLLVAGFDPYGNAGHQLLTRLYMDFLRMEGEFNFLALLPDSVQQQQWKEWYEGASFTTRNYIEENRKRFYHQTDIVYRSNDPKQELFTLLQQRLKPVLNTPYSLDHNRLPSADARSLARLENVRGLPASLLPQVTYLMVVGAEQASRVYTVIHNSAHSNISSLLNEESNLRPLRDTITVVKGILGDYPQAFWRVEETRLSSMIDAVAQLKTEQDYVSFMKQYGIRRSNPDFWQHADKLHSSYRQQNPISYGLLDFNRLENR